MPQFACLCLVTFGVGGLRKACWLTNHVGGSSESDSFSFRFGLDPASDGVTGT